MRKRQSKPIYFNAILVTEPLLCQGSHDCFNDLTQCFHFLYSPQSSVLFIQKILKVFYIQFSNLNKPISLIMASANCKNELVVLKQSKIAFNLTCDTSMENRLTLRNTTLEVGGVLKSCIVHREILFME